MNDQTHAAEFVSRNESVSSDARSAIQSAILINGGALGGMFALAGQETAVSKFLIQPHAIRECLIAFATGVATAAIASGTAYFTNYGYLAQLSFMISKDQKRARLFMRFGAMSHVISVGLILVSISSFLWGSIHAAFSIG